LERKAGEAAQRAAFFRLSPAMTITCRLDALRASVIARYLHCSVFS